MSHSLASISENSDKNSDPDATLNVVHQHAGVGEAAKDHIVPKQRRQQKRLEVADALANATSMPLRHSHPLSSFLQSDKVAKKPKPCPKKSQVTTTAPSLPGGADDEQVAADLPAKEESKDDKKSCFTGEVLYIVSRNSHCKQMGKNRLTFVLQGENRRFYGEATLAGYSENISTGDVCWCDFHSSFFCANFVLSLFFRLMSDNPERPYIGRIIAMWQDVAGDC